VKVRQEKGIPCSCFQ